jgi:hypothetical protein
MYLLKRQSAIGDASDFMSFSNVSSSPFPATFKIKIENSISGLRK